jgi:arginyl-tRNA synthetase
MGFDWADRAEHLSFGLYRFKGGKMSTRKGNFVTLNELIDLAEEKVRERIQERDADLPADVLENTVRSVALGAVVFHDLSTDPIRDPEFDVDSVTDFNGETGPYLQYAHTRCLSIVRKARESDELSKLAHDSFNPEQIETLGGRLSSDTEVELAKLLGRYPVVCEKVLQVLKPSLLATYLVDITKAFNAFYRENRVLDAQAPEQTEARLMLVEASRRVLNQGLNLLGIPLPERM